MHELLDETYEKMLTDSELSQKIFADALYKTIGASTHKWFKYSELDIDPNELEGSWYRMHNMHDQTVETVLENFEVLKKCEGPNTKQLRKYWDRIQELLDEVHPNPYVSECKFDLNVAANEIGWSLEFISDSFLE